MVHGGPDKRKRRRVRTRHAAWIKVKDSAQPIPCVLWDQSETGARIAAAHASQIPAIFALQHNKGETPRLCHVVWRKGPLVGVRFVETIEEANALARVKPATPRPEQTASSVVNFNFMRLTAPYGAGTATEGASPSSRAAAAFMLILIAATVVFYFAGLEAGAGSAWAVNVCHQADSLCQHPELGGGASVLMAIVYFAIRGMER
jgi:hypothetical protein